MAIAHRLIQTDLPVPTTLNTDGDTIIASGSTFITDGIIKAGDLVFNVTDGSTATVVSVDSETQITTTTLTGGSDNQYQIVVPDLLIIATQPTIIYPQNHRDQQGYLQFNITGTTPTSTVLIEGRADSDAPWTTILTLDQTGDDGTYVAPFNGQSISVPGSYVSSGIPIMPQMRATLSAIGGTGSLGLGLWLVE